MSHDSEPDISLASLMSEGAEGAGEDMSSPAPSAPSLPPESSRPRVALDSDTQTQIIEALATGDELPATRMLDLHQELLDTALDEPLHHDALQMLYATRNHQVLVHMWRQIGAQDIPRRHIVLPLIIARAMRANELEQIAALQAGLRLGHPSICQVARLMFAHSSHKVKITSVKVMEELGERPEHYFLTQQLEQSDEMDSALVTAIKRARQAIAERHPISEAAAGGELSLSHAAESGALSLTGQAHDPKLDQQLGARIDHLLDTSQIELLTISPAASLTTHSSAEFMELKADEQRRTKLIDAILFNQYTSWRVSVVVMLLTLVLQVGMAMLQQPIIALIFLGLIPLLHDQKLNHADPLRQIVFGDRVASVPLHIPPQGSDLATAELVDEAGETHKHYFRLPPQLKQELVAHPDRHVHIAWHPETQDSYLVESHSYLKLDERGSLALGGPSKANLVVVIALLNVITYIACLLLTISNVESFTHALQLEGYGVAALIGVYLAIKYNHDVQVSRF